MENKVESGHVFWLVGDVLLANMQTGKLYRIFGSADHYYFKG